LDFYSEGRHKSQLQAFEPQKECPFQASFFTSRLSSLLFAGFLIPLGPNGGWQLFDFGKIPPNKIVHNKDQMVIKVKQSASPLVYPFASPQPVQHILLKAELVGSPPSFPPGAQQGQKGYDDHVLRLGLIIPGPKRLSWWQRQVAPKWLLAMEKLMPPGQGVSRVEFITTCQKKEKLGQRTNHPLDSTLKVKCVKVVNTPGSFELEHSWPSPLQVMGLWIASDGDDTQSQFELHIKSIEINHK
jgi:hypothetical protein